MVLLEHILDSVQSEAENKGWKNHESSFEESLRRELVSAQKQIALLQDDLRELNKSYYIVLQKLKKS